MTDQRTQIAKANSNSPIDPKSVTGWGVDFKP
jgi:hypothetical protein